MCLIRLAYYVLPNSNIRVSLTTFTLKMWTYSFTFLFL